MRIRVLGLLALIATLLVVALPATAQPVPARIVAVGDLHGDYDAWAAIARAAGLIDGSGRWTGGATTLVQTGDIVDRGPDSLKIIDQLIRLQREAPGSGGRVVVLTGNHEAMMVINDLRYVHPGEYAAFVTPASSRTQCDWDDAFDHSTTTQSASASAFWMRSENSCPPLISPSHQTETPQDSSPLTSAFALSASARA